MARVHHSGIDCGGKAGGRRIKAEVKELVEKAGNRETLKFKVVWSGLLML